MPELHPAFRTWNEPTESLESVERRIHDGVPLGQLRMRAHGYVRSMYSLFPWAEPKPTDVVCEIGSGVGYIMEALVDQFRVKQIIGLDVAPAMIQHAIERLTRDGIEATAFKFQLYDGVTIPFEDHSIDHIYSVACLQHVPKLYVYNLFGEILRVLRNGYAVLQFLAFSHIAVQYRNTAAFRREIEQQMQGRPGHWHHFYSVDELTSVLGDGYGASEVIVKEKGSSIWVAFRNK